MVILFHQLPGASVQTSDVLNDRVWLLLMNVMTLIFNKKIPVKYDLLAVMSAEYSLFYNLYISI